jgi:hypothetical protein
LDWSASPPNRAGRRVKRHGSGTIAWATPIAALDVRPAHFSEREYYSAPEAEWVRTYPVYFPGREPAGYWEMLRARKPEPLIAPGARTEAAWIDGGRRVFDEMDVPTLGSTDPQLSEGRPVAA